MQHSVGKTDANVSDQYGWIDSQLAYYFAKATWSITEGVIFLINALRKFRKTFAALILTLGLLAGGVAAAHGSAALYTPDYAWQFSQTVSGKGSVFIDTATALTQGFTPGQTMSYQVTDTGGKVLGHTSMIIGKSGTLEFEGAVPGSVLSFQPVGGYYTFSTMKVPTIVTPPPPTQAASILTNPASGSATVTLTGNGSYHIIIMGDLSRPADVVTGGVSVITLPNLKPGTSIVVRVYGDGSGSGKLLDSATTKEPPVPLPDDTATKKVEFCYATHPRAEAYERMRMSVAEFLQGGYGDQEGNIIPPFSYMKNGETIDYPGHRWDAEGRSTFEKGCTVIPSSKPTETKPASPSPTVTETTKPTVPATTTGTATTTPSLAAPVTTSSTMAAAPSKNPGSRVETAAVAEGNSPWSNLLFGVAGIGFLSVLFFYRREAREAAARRH